jgi:hypothetical protein
LDICWQLLADPDVDLYRRALVNLLVACVANYAELPDKAKYATECLALMQQVREEGVRPKDAGHFREIVNHAEQILKAIEREAEDYRARTAAEGTTGTQRPLATSEEGEEGQSKSYMGQGSQQMKSEGS